MSCARPPKRSVSSAASARVIVMYPSASRHTRCSLAASLCQLGSARRSAVCEQLRHRAADRWRIAVGFVDERWPQAARKPQQHGGDAKVTRDDRIEPACRDEPDGASDIARAPHRTGQGRTHFEVQTYLTLAAVEHKCVAGGPVRVRTDRKRNLVSPFRERVARLEGLDAVRALQRKPDVGQIQDAHGRSAPLAIVARPAALVKARAIKDVPPRELRQAHRKDDKRGIGDSAPARAADDSSVRRRTGSRDPDSTTPAPPPRRLRWAPRLEAHACQTRGQANDEDR